MRVKIVFLVLATNDHEYHEDQKAQEATWGRLVEGKFRVYWVFGGAKKLEVHENRICLPIEDSFENILQKTIDAMRIIIKVDNPDIVIRTNSSSYFHLTKVEKVAKKLLELNFGFAGFLEKYIDPKTQQPEFFVNGSAIYLSRNAQKIIANLNHTEFFGVPDDVAINRSLISSGLQHTKTSRNNICYHHLFYPTAHIRVKGWGNRELTRMRMVAIHDFFTTQNLFVKVHKLFNIYSQEWKTSGVTLNKFFKYLYNTRFKTRKTKL